MVASVRELKQSELDDIVARASSRLITSAYVQAGSPFRADNRETIFEEFAVWRESFYNRLQAVLRAKGQDHFLALQYITPDTRTIRFIKGFSVPASLGFDEYTRVGQDIGFAVNGLEFYILDETVTWCIGTVVDVQFLTGDDAFFNAYYTSEAEKQEAVSHFLEFISSDDTLDQFKQMKSYIRYKLGGRWTQPA